MGNKYGNGDIFSWKTSVEGRYLFYVVAYSVPNNLVQFKRPFSVILYRPVSRPERGSPTRLGLFSSVSLSICLSLSSALVAPARARPPVVASAPARPSQPRAPTLDPAGRLERGVSLVLDPMPKRPLLPSRPRQPRPDCPSRPAPPRLVSPRPSHHVKIRSISRLDRPDVFVFHHPKCSRRGGRGGHGGAGREGGVDWIRWGEVGRGREPQKERGDNLIPR